MSQSRPSEEYIRDALQGVLPPGYVEQPVTTEESDLLGTMPIFSHRDARIDRRIEFVVSKGKERRGLDIAVLICASGNRRFALHDWIARHPEAEMLPTFSASADAGQRDEEIDTWIHRVRALFSGPLREILDGTRWEEVPVDWQGLR